MLDRELVHACGAAVFGHPESGGPGPRAAPRRHEPGPDVEGLERRDVLPDVPSSTQPCLETARTVVLFAHRGGRNDQPRAHARAR